MFFYVMGEDHSEWKMVSDLTSIAGQKHAYRGATDAYILPYLTVACSFAPVLRVKHSQYFVYIPYSIILSRVNSFYCICAEKKKPF